MRITKKSGEQKQEEAKIKKKKKTRIVGERLVWSESRETSTPINAPKSTIELSILLFRSFKHGTRRGGENEHETQGQE